MMKMLEPISIGNLTLKNRIIRSATYEGGCDENGFPGKAYYDMYEKLASHGPGAIISGFSFTSEDGKAMQAKQAGIDSDEKIKYYSRLTEGVHKHDCPVFLQISHSGRQTVKARVGGRPVSSCSKRSWYFRVKPRPLSLKEVYEKVNEYGLAAHRAQAGGFDGIQIHAAHGYLVHQFLLPSINKRKDEFGVDYRTGIGTRFLEEIITSIRKYCGDDYPILVKISGATDLKPAFDMNQFSNLVIFLDEMKVDGIEISYGTMDHALNIIRGDLPVKLILRENPFLGSNNRIRKEINQCLLNAYYQPVRKSFSPAYNLDFAKRANGLTNIPIISVGGFRSTEEITEALENGDADIVSMSRPFIAEPDLVDQIIQNKSWESSCINCNYCAVMCDSGRPTKCYHN